MTTSATLVVSNISQLVTASPKERDDAIVTDGIVICQGERILYAGDAKHAPTIPRAKGCTEIDAQGHAVIPGFVDSHTHAVWIGDRRDEYVARAKGVSYEGLASKGGGIAATVDATAKATIDELVEESRPRLEQMRSSGTTTVEVKSGYGRTLDAEIRQLKAAVKLGTLPTTPRVYPTYLPLHATPKGNRGSFIADICSRGVGVAAAYAHGIDAFCERGAFSVDECRAVLVAGKEAGLHVHVHAEQLSHSGGAALAASLGAASADHLDHVSPADIVALAKAHVTAVLLPGASLLTGGRNPSGRTLVDRGVNVALATDCNPGSCYTTSMPLMVSLAVATCGLTPYEALVAGTRGGASALALRDVGSLEPGHRCDLVVLATPHWVDLAYQFGSDQISTVVMDGVVVS